MFMEPVTGTMPLNVKEPEFLSYPEILNGAQEFDFSNFYSFMRPKIRQTDVFSFNSLYQNSFGNDYFDIGFLEYPVEVSGAVTEAREKAAEDILEYMVSSGILKQGEIDSIYFDRNLPKNVLGRTGFDGNFGDVDVAYNPRIFDESYESIRDPVIRDAVKYIQARTLKHERVHEEMLSGPDAYRVAINLSEMGYSEDMFKGILEGLAELETENAFYEAGDTKFGDKVHNESPYKRQLQIIEGLEHFNYSDGETVYKGARGCYEALARGLLDKETVNDLFGGIELKSDFMPAYKNSGTCGKYS